MTDGFANDDYRKALEVIKKNRNFRSAVKIGFAIGDKPDTEMIARVVGSTEAVIRTENLGIFAKLIQFVSVTSSTMASTSHVMGDAVTGGRVVAEVLNREGISDDVIPTEIHVKDLDPISPNDTMDDPNDVSWDSEEW